MIGMQVCPGRPKTFTKAAKTFDDLWHLYRHRLQMAVLSRIAVIKSIDPQKLLWLMLHRPIKNAPRGTLSSLCGMVNCLAKNAGHAKPAK